MAMNRPAYVDLPLTADGREWGNLGMWQPADIRQRLEAVLDGLSEDPFIAFYGISAEGGKKPPFFWQTLAWLHRRDVPAAARMAGIIRVPGALAALTGTPDGTLHHGPYDPLQNGSPFGAPVLFYGTADAPACIGWLRPLGESATPSQARTQRSQDLIPQWIQGWFRRHHAWVRFPGGLRLDAYAVPDVAGDAGAARGDSMGLSCLLTHLAWHLNRPLPEDLCATGAIDGEALVLKPVLGLPDKMRVARDWGYTRMLVVRGQQDDDGRALQPPAGLELIEISPDPDQAVVDLYRLAWNVDLRLPAWADHLPMPLACGLRDLQLAIARSRGFESAHLVRRLYDLLVQSVAMLAAASYLQRPDRTDALDFEVLGKVIGVIGPDYADWVQTLDRAAAQAPGATLPGLSGWVARWTTHFKTATAWRAATTRGRSPADDRAQLADAIGRLDQLRPALESCAGLLTAGVLVGRGTDGQPHRWMGLAPEAEVRPDASSPDLCLWLDGVGALPVQPLARIGAAAARDAGTAPGHLWYLEELRESGRVTWFDPITSRTHVLNDAQGDALVQGIARGIPAYARSLDPHGVERERRRQADIAAQLDCFYPDIRYRTRDHVRDRILACPGGYLLLTGPSGAGKSFLADHLATAAHPPGGPAGCLIHPGRPEVVMPVLLAKARRGLGSHASVLLPDLFKAAGTHGWLTTWLAETGQTLHNQPAITADPAETRLALRRWIAELLDLLPGRRLLLIIDGLDEMDAPPTGAHEFLDCLPHPDSLPSGCVVLLGSRPLAECRDALHPLVERLVPADRRLALDPAAADYRADLEAWVAERAARTGRPALDAGTKARIWGLARGRWRYVHHFIDVLATGLFADVQDLPDPADWYPVYFAALRDRLGPELFDACHGRLLTTLAMTETSLCIDDFIAFGVSRGDINRALLDMPELIGHNCIKTDDCEDLFVFSLSNDLLLNYLQSTNVLWQSCILSLHGMENWFFERLTHQSVIGDLVGENGEVNKMRMSAALNALYLAWFNDGGREVDFSSLGYVPDDAFVGFYEIYDYLRFSPFHCDFHKMPKFGPETLVKLALVIESVMEGCPFSGDGKVWSSIICAKLNVLYNDMNDCFSSIDEAIDEAIKLKGGGFSDDMCNHMIMTSNLVAVQSCRAFGPSERLVKSIRQVLQIANEMAGDHGLCPSDFRDIMDSIFMNADRESAESLFSFVLNNFDNLVTRGVFFTGLFLSKLYYLGLLFDLLHMLPQQVKKQGEEAASAFPDVFIVPFFEPKLRLSKSMMGRAQRGLLSISVSQSLSPIELAMIEYRKYISSDDMGDKADHLLNSWKSLQLHEKSRRLDRYKFNAASIRIKNDLDFLFRKTKSKILRRKYEEVASLTKGRDVINIDSMDPVEFNNVIRLDDDELINFDSKTPISVLNLVGKSRREVRAVYDKYESEMRDIADRPHRWIF